MQLLTYKFDVEQYQQMGKVGIFHPESRVELIDGEIVVMSPIGLKHIATINRMNYFLHSNIKENGIISTQNSIRLSNYSEPQPDIAILRPRDDFYAGKFPEAEDVLLLIEIADFSLRYDQTNKLRLYAEYGISEYWIANVEREIVEIYHQPNGKAYLKQTLIDSPDNAFTPIAFPAIVMTLKDIFG
ncbi:Uma2 family endonuclease [Pseudanabaena minima]|uniref:Uma2 family endonuclease n=1 Tax=Pseudanabaena minima TaxID=890415 RepID=UPI003DA81793